MCQICLSNVFFNKFKKLQKIHIVRIIEIFQMLLLEQLSTERNGTVCLSD